MRLTGLWWWIDRWRKSTAYMDMTLEQQGAYRNLLDEAALRSGPIPNDERVLAKACGDAKRWPKVRDVVLARFELQADGWHNATLDEVIARSEELRTTRAAAGRNGGRRTQANRQAKPQANVVANTQAPDPDPDPYVVPSELLRRRGRGHPPLAMNLKRLKFWRWMAEAMIAQLGPHADEFDLDAWIHERDDTETRVITGDWWDYWLPAFEAEVKRRGLPIAATPDEKRMFKEPTQADVEAQLAILHRHDRR